MANLIKILQEQKDFSETEIMIATYLLANFRKLAGMSTRQLGKNTYTNSARHRGCLRETCFTPP